MKTRIAKFLASASVIGVVAIILIIPESTQAAQLVPAACENGIGCNLCHFVELANNVVKWLIGILSVIFGVLFFIAGFGMITSGGNSGKLEDAKKSLTNALVGFLIVLSAWLIVDTLLKAMLPDNGLTGVSTGFGMWNEINCAGGQRAGTPLSRVALSANATAGANCTPTGPGTGEQRCTTTSPEPIEGQDCTFIAPTGNYSCSVVIPLGSYTAGNVAIGSMTHSDALAALNGITVTSTAGPGGVQAVCPTGTGCTTLNGMREQTVQQIVNIDAACPSCNIVVVGGTEPGHAGGAISHGTGYKVDLDDSPALDAYFTSTLRLSGQRGGDHGGAIYTDSCGNEYVRESTHWDITVTAGSCRL